MSGPIVVAVLVKNRAERLRVALDQWQSHDLLDIRVTTQIGESGAWSPTKKGVSVNVSLIPALREALAAAEAKARELGLLDG